MKRYLLLSQSMGVYLGSCMGMGFWSKLDSVGQTQAITFDSPTTIQRAMAEWDGLASLPSDLSYSEIEVVDKGGYATEAECVAAGVESWTDKEVNHRDLPRRGRTHDQTK